MLSLSFYFAGLAVIGTLSELVLDFEYAQKYCLYCVRHGPNPPFHNCRKNYQGATNGNCYFSIILKKTLRV